MRQKKTIALVIGFLMFSTISQASNFPLSKLNLGNSQTEQESIVPTHSGNLPLQEEPASTSSTPRASLEEDEDDTSKEKILTTTTLFVLIFISHYISCKMFSRHWISKS